MMDDAATKRPASVFVSLWASTSLLNSKREVEATVHMTEGDAIDHLADLMEDADGGTRGYDCTIEVPMASCAPPRRIDLTDAAAEEVRERQEEREGAEIEARMARWRASGL